MMQKAWLTTSSAMAEGEDAMEGYFRFYKELKLFDEIGVILVL
jgi:hypothetical protein